MKQFGFLVIIVIATIPQGYGIKCNSCEANSQGSPNGCQTPSQVTCAAHIDRCYTLKSLTEMSIPGVGVIKMTMEMRNCSVSAMQCTEATKQEVCQHMNSTGDLKSCNFSCCEGDLCNDGSNPPGGGLTPLKPASNVSLSCYECSPEGMGPNGTGTPLISCKAPKERECGMYGPGMPFDRCMTIKLTGKNPSTGALLEQEARNCSFSSMCSGNTVCNLMNSTGEIVKCHVQCCEGNLCDGVPQPSTTSDPSSSGPSTSGPPPSSPPPSSPSPSGPTTSRTSPSSPSPSSPSPSGPTTSRTSPSGPSPSNPSQSNTFPSSPPPSSPPPSSPPPSSPIPSSNPQSGPNLLNSRGGQSPLAVSGILIIISIIMTLALQVK